MRGRFTLRDGVIRLNPFGFDVPGADVEIRGVYGLRSEQLDFAGTLSMDAPDLARLPAAASRASS